MPKPKLIRITTIPLSLEKLLEGQLEYMQDYFEVTAISSEKERLETLGRERGYNTYYLEMTRQITPLSDLKAVFKLCRFLKKESPAIVHTHTPKAGIVGMLASYLAKVPVRLHTVAGLPLMEAKGKKRKLLNLVEKFTYKFATKVYPNSKGLYDFIVDEKFTQLEKLKIIGEGSSNGIDLQYFNPDLFVASRNSLRKELNIPQDSFVFVFVGRLVKDKGINELVNAFQNLSHSPLTTYHSSLLLVGPLESELDPLNKDILEAIHTNPNIISVGFQQDVRPYFAAADALALPSYREGFPNVVLQAGAMNLPSIVSNINGCNEIITHNVNGLIVPSKNTKALGDAMRLMMDDDSLYMQLKSKARDLIASRYERQRVWDALLEEYESQLNNKV